MVEQLSLQKCGDGIAVLTFNRPEALNAMSLAMMRRFAEIITELQADNALCALILTGAGTESFCSGGDLFELSQKPTEEDARSFISLMGDALLEMEQLPVPVIAAINGYALGGGSEIFVACDIRIVDEKARLGFVQIGLALTPGWGAGQRLLRLVGYSKAMQLLLSGSVLKVDELQSLGLVIDVVPVGTALDAALTFARTHITPNPPAVVRSIKTLLRAGLEQPPGQAITLERDLFPPLWAAEPHSKAVEVFLNKQKNKKDNS
jgi:enoyl-CoA hydratase